MKSKKLLLIITCIFTLLFVTGCGTKEAITTEKFNKIAEEEELIITDAKDQFEDKTYVKDASIASNVAGWQIEFYTFEDEDSAKEMYASNKSNFEETKEDSKANAETNIEGKNYQKYTLSANDYYMHICRVDNTVIYLKVPDKYKDDVKNIIKKLGY